MRGSIEWRIKPDLGMMAEIDNHVTAALLDHSVKNAYPKADAMHTRAQQNCVDHNDECLPYDNFLEVAFREELRTQLGIKSGSKESFTFNEWYAKKRSVLLNHLHNS